MAKIEEKIPLKKGTSEFQLIGEAQITDFTFKMDQSSTKSDWVYNSLNLGVNCGNGNIVYSELMGGYGATRDNVLYVHGVKEDDNKKKQDDWGTQFTIDWDDRFDEEVLETIGEKCFIKVGLEKVINKDKKEVTYTKKFLSAYDAIAYVQEHLKAGMVINVKGEFKYSMYDGNVQMKKEIKSIFLSKVDDPAKYKASFTQTVLLDKDSIGKLDKQKAVYPINVKIVDYIKMWGDKEVKTNIPFNKIMELEVNKSDVEKTKKFLDSVLKVKKGITEITLEGDIVEGASTTTLTEDDLPDEIKELIEMGAYTLEDALATLVVRGDREKRLIIRRPAIKMVGNDENKKPTIMKTEEKYSEDDLIFDFMFETEEEDVEEIVAEVEDKKTTTKKVVVDTEDDDEVDVDEDEWMNALLD